MNIFVLILFCVMSFVAGILIGIKGHTEDTVGTIIIDHQSIPEDEPYLFLKTKISPYELMKKKTVAVDISIEKLISHE